ncbi:MAG: phosphoribosyl-ATP diphosphatase [Spirochaetales bacterium]|nr:phosphoribosyl-ATP diphosphatase [Spirochaetales bacterium]
MNAEIKPYIITSATGKVVKLLQTNEKGYKKSIENNQLWAVNPETERLLPEECEGKIKSFAEKEDWYQAIIEEPKSATEDKTEIKEMAESSSCGSEIIERLYKIIEQRKKELPEGSYTTHLFNSGISKIKKKTGEEAVELLLAENKSETIYEAADLIYHMLVLLAAENIKPEDIFLELSNRE